MEKFHFVLIFEKALWKVKWCPGTPNQPLDGLTRTFFVTAYWSTLFIEMKKVSQNVCNENIMNINCNYWAIKNKKSSWRIFRVTLYFTLCFSISTSTTVVYGQNTKESTVDLPCTPVMVPWMNGVTKNRTYIIGLKPRFEKQPGTGTHAGTIMPIFKFEV